MASRGAVSRVAACRRAVCRVACCALRRAGRRAVRRPSLARVAGRERPPRWPVRFPEPRRLRLAYM